MSEFFCIFAPKIVAHGESSHDRCIGNRTEP